MCVSQEDTYEVVLTFFVLILARLMGYTQYCTIAAAACVFIDG